MKKNARILRIVVALSLCVVCLCATTRSALARTTYTEICPFCAVCRIRIRQLVEQINAPNHPQPDSGIPKLGLSGFQIRGKLRLSPGSIPPITVKIPQRTVDDFHGKASFQTGLSDFRFYLCLV